MTFHGMKLTIGGRILLAEALQMPLGNMFRLHLDYGSVSQLKWHSGVLQVGFVNR